MTIAMRASSTPLKVSMLSKLVLHGRNDQAGDQVDRTERDAAPTHGHDVPTGFEGETG